MLYLFFLRSWRPFEVYEGKNYYFTSNLPISESQKSLTFDYSVIKSWKSVHLKCINMSWRTLYIYKTKYSLNKSIFKEIIKNYCNIFLSTLSKDGCFKFTNCLDLRGKGSVYLKIFWARLWSPISISWPRSGDWQIGYQPRPEDF